MEDNKETVKKPDVVIDKSGKEFKTVKLNDKEEKVKVKIKNYKI